jgi:hypothetical protein
MHKQFTIFKGLLFVTVLISVPTNAQNNIELGDRPLQLVAAMDESALKQKLSQCDLTTIGTSALAIGHRGAARRDNTQSIPVKAI